MRLFHFSERGDIAAFVPRPVAIPAPRASGMAWLNGPLVWAIDDWHQPLYLFPRDCPRILLWPTAGTTAEDRHAHGPASPHRMIAYIEQDWLVRLGETILYRYTLPADGFETLDDAGMWVSRLAATPTKIEAITDLAAALAEARISLQAVDDLEPILTLRATSLHLSAIRLRNRRKQTV